MRKGDLVRRDLELLRQEGRLRSLQRLGHQEGKEFTEIVELFL